MAEPLNFGRPWLEEPEWASRRIVYRYNGRKHGCFWGTGVLFFIFVGTPLGLTVGMTLDREDSGLSLLLVGVSWTAAAAIAVWWAFQAVLQNPQAARGMNSWTSPRQPFEMVCHLRTFPGVIGGWFKAEIEVPLPETPTEFHLYLVCLKQHGKHSHVVWRAEARLPPTSARARDGVYRIPVVFQIPELEKYNAPRCRWTLSVVAVSGEGVAYNGTFKVPVFATRLAPSSEQRAPAQDEGE